MELKEILCELNANLDKLVNTETYQPTQYEQELWDKVAVAAIPSVITAEYTMATPEQVAKYAFEYADAFMAERAKRMKGDVK